MGCGSTLFLSLSIVQRIVIVEHNDTGPLSWARSSFMQTAHDVTFGNNSQNPK